MKMDIEIEKVIDFFPKTKLTECQNFKIKDKNTKKR